MVTRCWLRLLLLALPSLLFVVPPADASDQPAPSAAAYEMHCDNGDVLFVSLREADAAGFSVVPSVSDVALRVPAERVEALRLRVGGDARPVSVVLKSGLAVPGVIRECNARSLTVGVERIGQVTFGWDEVKGVTALPATQSQLDDHVLDRRQLDALWQRLGSRDADEAMEAFVLMARGGERSVAYLHEKLRSPPDSPQVIRRLIEQLDAESWAAREAAMQELAQLGRLAMSALRSEAVAPVSLEAEWRINHLLELLQQDAQIRSRDVVRTLRAVRVLEAIGSEKAVAVLHRLGDRQSQTPTVLDARFVYARATGGWDAPNEAPPAIELVDTPRERPEDASTS